MASPRVGRGGRRFDLLSFRAIHNLPTTDVDARRTRTGRVLREYSLGHLPMLLNVMRGDMGIVGPRPTEPDRVDPRDPYWRRVLSMPLTPRRGQLGDRVLGQDIQHNVS